jgi:hypothetical protein
MAIPLVFSFWFMVAAYTKKRCLTKNVCCLQCRHG